MPGANPKYYGRDRGLTRYNMLSDQFSGLGGIVVPRPASPLKLAQPHRGPVAGTQDLTRTLPLL